jgi:hypothetical protein
LSTRCVRNRLVASLSTNCNNAVILSSCYKVVTHNLSTRCVRNRLLVASLSTSCNNAVTTVDILLNCRTIVYKSLKQLVSSLLASSVNTSFCQVVGTALLHVWCKFVTNCTFLHVYLKNISKTSTFRLYF